MVNNVIVILIPDNFDIELLGKVIEGIGGEVLFESGFDLSHKIESNNQIAIGVAFVGVSTMQHSRSTIPYSYNRGDPNPHLRFGLLGPVNNAREIFDELALKERSMPIIMPFERHDDIEPMELIDLFPFLNSRSKETVLFLKNYGHTFRKTCIGGIFGRKHLRQKVF